MDNMAKLVFIQSTSKAMEDIALSPGQIIYCADVPITYYDTTGLKRTGIDKVSYSYAESDRLKIAINRLNSETLYIVTSTGTFWRWSLATDWEQIYYTSDMVGILTLTENLVPSTIEQGGTYIAPKTIATQVYTKAGERVEDVLDDITRIGKTHRYIPITDVTQRTYNVPLPFNNYFELGNYVDIFIGSVWISPKRYSIITNDNLPVATTDIVFADDEEVLTLNREICVVYTYNTPRVKDMVYAGLTGGYIVDGSIPIRKLEKYSDSYLVDDGTSVATSKAVYQAYNDLSTKIEYVAGNLIAYATSYHTGIELKTDIDNFELVDNSTIYLRLHTDMMAGATLTVNAGLPIPIYLNYKEPVKKGLQEGDVVSLTYSKYAGKFFVNASQAYKLAHYSQIYTCNGGDSTIPITIEDFLPGYDTLNVSHNNLKLYEGINYEISGHNLVLNYSAKKDDIIEITLDKVVGHGLPIEGNTIMKEISFTNNVEFKRDASFGGDITFANGSLDKEGNLELAGNITSSSTISGGQLESTIEDKPPLVVKSTKMVENLNADMVDDHHVTDLAVPDKTFEFFIDDGTELIVPNVYNALKSFLGRIEAITEAMVITDSKDLLTATKLSYDDFIATEGISFDPEEPLVNESVRDTIEEILYRIDCVRFTLLSTQSTDDLGIDIDSINEMDGSEVNLGETFVPDLSTLYPTWEEMAYKIDIILDEIEEQILVASESQEEINSHDKVSEVYDTIDIDKYDISYSGKTTKISGYSNSTYSNGRLGKERGLYASPTSLPVMYLKTEEKRFYPITHKNAIIGLPSGDVATVKSLQETNDMIAALENRIQYLETLVKQMLADSNNGNGNLLLLEGNATPV